MTALAGPSVLRREVTADGEIGVDIWERRGGADGPHVVVLGGVHGDEVGGILAAGMIADSGWALSAGRLSVVPVAHEAARHTDSRVSLEDGGNLARSFPGRRDGRPTERLADLLATRVLSDADVLIDLHTSSRGADMPLFVGCLDDGSEPADRGVRLAHGFGMPLLWTHPTLGPGRTLTVAAENGIPALYVESPVGGVVDREHLRAYVDGVRSVLEAVGMLPAGPARPAPALWLHGDGDTDAFSAVSQGGYFERSASLLDTVAQGAEVGRVLDVFGRVVETVTAPAEGVVTTLQRTAAVAMGQPVVGVTAVRPASLRLPSDDLMTRRSTHDE